jgi:hypothetical protein
MYRVYRKGEGVGLEGLLQADGSWLHRFHDKGTSQVVAEFATREEAAAYCRDQSGRGDAAVFYVARPEDDLIIDVIYGEERGKTEMAASERSRLSASMFVYALFVLPACYFWAPDGLGIYLAAGLIAFFWLAWSVIGAKSNFMAGLIALGVTLVFANALASYLARHQ